MFQNIGFTELILIAVVALVIFGPQKLPEIGRMLGRTLRDFKQATNELLSDEPKPQKVNPPLVPDPVTPIEMATKVAVQAEPEPEAPSAPLAQKEMLVDTVQPFEQKPAVSFVTNTSPVVIHVAGHDGSKDASTVQADDSEGTQRSGGASSSKRLPD